MPTYRTDGAKSSAKDRVSALKKTIEASVETLAAAVDEVRASNMFRDYLDVQARFHKYSWCNTLLCLEPIVVILNSRARSALVGFSMTALPSRAAVEHIR